MDIQIDDMQFEKVVSNLEILEALLRKSEERCNTIVNASKDAIIAVDETGLITMFNAAAEKIFGRNTAEMIGLPLDCLIPEEFKARHREYVESYFIKGTPHNFMGETVELPALHSSGKVFPIELSLSKGKCEGEPFVLAVIRDITRRKRAEEDLKDSRERLKSFYDAAFEGIAVIDQGRFIDVNEQFTALFGYERDELIGREVLDLVAAEDYELVSGYIQSGFEKPYECKVRHKDGYVKFMEVRGQQIQFRGRPVRVTAVHDITERKRAEEALRTSEDTLKSIFRAAPTGIGLVRERVLTQVNDTFCEMVGYSSDELLGKNARMLYPSEEEFESVGREKYKQIRKYGTGIVETRLKRKDGGVIDVLLSSTPIDQDDWTTGVTFTALDITEQIEAEKAKKALEGQLFEIQKTEAIGTLAGGIAHDFNNILAPIVGYTELVLDDIEKGSQSYENLKEVFIAGQRAKDMVKQILTLSRQ